MEWPSLVKWIALGVAIVVISVIAGAIDVWWEQRKREKEKERERRRREKPD